METRQLAPVLDNAGYILTEGDTIQAKIPKALSQVYHIGEIQRAIIKEVFYWNGVPWLTFNFRGAILLTKACEVFKVFEGRLGVDNDIPA